MPYPAELIDRQEADGSDTSTMSTWPLSATETGTPKHVRVLSGMPDVAVTVVDRDPLRLAEAGRAFPMVPLDESLDHVLPTVDGVIVATPPGSHAAIAHAAMRADCHVLVEKPLATTVADCESLIDAAILNDVHLMVGHTFEHDAAIWKLRDIANSGELGQIRSAGHGVATCRSWWDP